MTTLKLEPIVLKAAALGDVNPMPDLKNVSYIHAGFETTSRVTREDRTYFGKGAISTLLPYLSQDGYDRQRKDTVFQAAVLENEFMKAVFLPQLGGRLWSLYHKKLGRELLYVNDIVQPCNLGLRNAWVAGGVEWNVSIKGHTPFTCETIFAARSENSKGEPVLSMYEYERIRGVVFGINAYLQEDRLYIRTTVENCSGKPTYTYWWSNIAVPEKGVRVLTDAGEMFSCVYEDNHYTIDRIPAPGYSGRDLSYPENAPHAGDMFYILPDDRRKWIAALDTDGTGLLQYSTPELKGRKMFFWGDGEGGRNWNRFLTGREDAYIEIQAGLLRTQMEHIPMPEAAVWSWTECYTAASLEPELLHGDWHTASGSLARQVAAMPDPAEADIPLTARKEICVMGSGWGALEGRNISAFYDFPASSMNELQDEWRMLKQEGYLPEPGGEEPPQSYQITPQMLALLEKSVETPRGDHWYSWLHIGVVRYALGDLAGAKQAWEVSCARKQTPWALRNLAVLHKNEFDEREAAMKYIRKAVSLCASPCRGLLTDAAKILTECGQPAAWLEIFAGLPDDLRRNGRLLLYTAIAHMDRGDFAAAKAILNEDFAMTDIKEGELSLTAVWARLYGEEKKLPRHLNFRMHEK